MKDFPETFPSIQRAESIVRKIISGHFPPEPLEKIDEDLLLHALEVEMAEFDERAEK